MVSAKLMNFPAQLGLNINMQSGGRNKGPDNYKNHNYVSKDSL
ncbi:hypothetical protein LINPERHAP1_LOCUS15964 [Linum perenne]